MAYARRIAAALAAGWVVAHGSVAAYADAAPSPEVALQAGKRGVADEPVAVAVRLDKVGLSTRLSFDLSKTVQVTAFTLENPDRVVVEAPEVNFQVDAEAGRLKPGTSNLVKSFRFGQFAQGKSRIIIDLSGPASIQKVAVEPIAGGEPSRLSIQLIKSDRTAFHQSAVRPAQIATETSDVMLEPAETTGHSRPVVVIDPGHGGVDPGASGYGGAIEKLLVFDFASALAEKLNATGRYTVVMTRTGDAFVSLSDRVKIAREAKAALFVSVHADTVADGANVTGATVYTASDKASDAEAARVAESENKADEAAGIETAPDASGVSDILFDLTRRETRTFSHQFQRTLAGYWQKIARLNKNPERSAGFMVLKAPDVPSVLLELGYLSSQKDVEALTSAEWRDKATGSVAGAIDTFFAPRLRDQQTAGAQLDSAAGDADKSAIVVLRPHL